MGGWDFGRSIALAFPRSANRDSSDRHDREWTEWQGNPTAPYRPRSASSVSVSDARPAPRSCSREAATSRSRRWACCAPSWSATSFPTSSSGAPRARSTAPPSRPRRASAASSGSRRRGPRCGATRCSRAVGSHGHGTSSPATTTSSRTRASGTSSPGATPPRPSRNSSSRCGSWRPTSTPVRRWCSPSGPLQPALLASAALPGIYPPIRHDGRTLVDGAVVDTVPLWHALSTAVDRIYVMNVAGDLLERPLRSPIDVAVRAFAISRKQRFELEVRSVPETVELVQLPAPVDERELFDFSGGEALIDIGVRARQPGPRRRRRRAPTPPPAPPPLLAPRRQLSRFIAPSRSRCGTPRGNELADPGDDVGQQRGVLGPVDERGGHDAEHDGDAGETASTTHVPASTRRLRTRSVTSPSPGVAATASATRR